MEDIRTRLARSAYEPMPELGFSEPKLSFELRALIAEAISEIEKLRSENTDLSNDVRRAKAIIKSRDKAIASAKEDSAAHWRFRTYVAKHAPMTLQAYGADRKLRTAALDRLSEWNAEHGFEY